MPQLPKGKSTSKLKVLGIAGSPRRDGNTDLLLREVMAGAASQRAQIKIVILSELNISPCRHCDGCLKTGKCVIDDDMQWLHTDLKEADRLVLASPIFFMGVTAQTKAMIDRCQALWVIKYVLKLPLATNTSKERKGIFVSVGGTKLSNLFQPAITTVKSWFTTLDISYDGELVFSGIDEKDAIIRHPTALKDAFATGRQLVPSTLKE
ncbi:MAG TPA: flavodoxin family protein [Dehalococcoidia bacterium]|nr:flavodoxin family protein [Dehalococcoidia bacterium]